MLKSILREVLDLDDTEISKDIVLQDIETWDSLSHMTLIARIEESFEVELTGKEISTISSVSDLVSMLESRQKECDLK
tara:strand:- start:365 stop:598 length:234 start_codon:yes stop_codon:yes gene_type:complete